MKSWHLLALLMVLGSGSRPAVAFAEGAAVAPRSEAEAELLFRRANDTFLAGKPGEAARHYQVLVAAGFGTSDVHYNLGTAALGSSCELSTTVFETTPIGSSSGCCFPQEWSCPYSGRVAKNLRVARSGASNRDLAQFRRLSQWDLTRGASERH